MEVKGVLTAVNISASETLNPYDTPPVSPDAMDDEFNGTSLDGKWTQQNSPSVITVANGKLSWVQSLTGSFNLRSILQPISGTSWTVISKFTKCLIYGGSWARIAMSVYNSANNHYLSSGLCNYVSSNPQQCTLTSYASPSIITGDLLNFLIPTLATILGITTTTYGGIYLRIRLLSGTLYFEYSWDGVTWVEMYNRSVSSDLGAITHVGLSIDGSNSTAQTMEVDFFRKTS